MWFGIAWILRAQVFNIRDEKELEILALDIYRFQYVNNLFYRDYCDAVRRDPGKVRRMTEIPFLPISFFKSHRVGTTAFDAELVFESSGTTGKQTSCHFVKSAELYKRSFYSCFYDFFGDPAEYCILGLLPSYLERGNSSLVYMVDHLIKKKPSWSQWILSQRIWKTQWKARATGKQSTKKQFFLGWPSPFSILHANILSIWNIPGWLKQAVWKEGGKNWPGRNYTRN